MTGLQEAVAADDRLLHDLVLGHWRMPALAAADRTGLLTALAAGPLTPAGVSAGCGTGQTATAAVLDLLASIGLLDRRDGCYGLTPEARRYLLPDSPHYWGPMLRLVWDDQCAAVRDALVSGGPSGYKGRSIWSVHERVPRQAEVFTRAMHAYGAAPAAAFAERFGTLGLPDDAHVLDVAGGAGTYAIALAARYPRLRVTLLELGSTCVLAKAAVAEAGVQDRVQVLEGDMFAAPWPRADAVLLADVMHNWPVRECRTLAARARDALHPDGLLLVHEMLLDDAAPGPAPTAANAVAMAATTGGHQFTAVELTDLLVQAGMAAVEARPAFGYFSLVVAHPAQKERLS